jgi:hypothetical protein
MLTTLVEAKDGSVVPTCRGALTPADRLLPLTDPTTPALIYRLGSAGACWVSSAAATLTS